MAITYLISPARIKAITEVHDNVDDKILKRAILTAQDIELEVILGTALTNKLKEYVTAGTLGSHAAYQTLINDYVENCLAYYALEQLVDLITYKIYNKGAMKREAEETQQLTSSELLDLKRGYRTKAEIYGDRLIRYLIQNQSSFSEYLSGNTELQNEKPKKRGWSPGFSF